MRKSTGLPFRKAGEFQISRFQGIAVADYSFALDALALKPSSFCNVGVYKKLRWFRAGIESGISWLNRSFGLTHCTWKGFRSFKCYILASVVVANLLTMAKKKLVTT